MMNRFQRLRLFRPEGAMAAPPPTPHLASLGVVLGPGLLDQLREMVSQGTINYNKLLIAFILELR